MKKNSVIIVSGGMDSITLLYDHKDEIALGISFDYGSNHNAREIPFATKNAVQLAIVKVDTWVVLRWYVAQFYRFALARSGTVVAK